MPNKDSFTFSDKLKKSKSLPLSKRIPSKVGGDGKAKRTLIQRAQRDLPFIIVAAAALLLLPILSRNSGTDDQGVETPMDFVAPDSSVSDSGGLGQEIAPSSGFKNPLDYIVSRSGKDTEGNRDSIDAGEEDSSYDTATTPPYTSEKAERATETYAPAAKGAIRNALVRKATQIASLRNSKTMAAGASTGVSRSLATGSAASSGGGASGPRVGTRPVALQPMTSAGKGGRSETGEGLYAEAARSLGAMNKAGSKQALFDAQLKNVDGTPLGSIGAGPNFGSGAGKLGAGGAPSNNVGYKPYLPWWWDFEKQKAMKHWELWNYNFQKALSDNIIKVGTGLALCLATGNADGKVDKFLGDPGGADDYTCPGGNVQDWSSHRDLMGKDESGSGDSKETKAKGDFNEWVRLCNESNGNKGYKTTASSKKDMLDVRLRCLGLKYKKTGLYNWLQKAEYSDKYNCMGVSAGSGIIKFELSSTKASKADKMGHYVVAKDMANKTEPQVIYVAKGGRLNGVSLQARIKDLNAIKNGDFVVTKVVGFTLNGAGSKMATDRVSSLQAQINDLNSYDLDEQKALTKTKTQKKADGTKENVVVSDYNSQLASLKQQLEEAQKNSGRSEGVSDADFQSVLARIEADIKSGAYKSEGYVEEQFSLKVQKTCSVGTSFYATKFEKMQHTLRGSSSDAITCGEPFKYVKIKDPRDFSVTITKPGACTYAVVVEKSPIAKDKYVVKHVVDFQSGYNNQQIVVNPDGSKTFKFDIVVGLDETSTVPADVAERSNGNGWVIWVTNNSCDGVNVKPEDELSNPDPANVINTFSAGGEKHDVCRYRWACGTGGCPAEEKPNTKEYCKKSTNGITGDGGIYDVYEATPLGRDLSVASGKAIATGVNNKSKAGELKKSFGEMGWFKEFLIKANGNDDEPLCMECFTGGIPKECTDICVDTDGKINIKTGTEFKPAVPELDRKNYPSLTNENCPDCQKPVTAVPEPKKADCSFNAGANFDTGSHMILGSSVRVNIRGNVANTGFYNKCLSALVQDPNKKEINIYVTGFTSQSGDGTDSVRCTGTVCEPVTGNNIAVELKNSNFVLSEDRAISVAESLVQEINAINNENQKPLLLAYEMDFTRTGNIASHFAKHEPRTDEDVKAVKRKISSYSNVSGAENTVKLRFIVKGVGSYDASTGNKASDRQVAVSIYPETKRISAVR